MQLLRECPVHDIIDSANSRSRHLYNRGTKIHMRNALKLGATPGEIVEMLEITSLMGIHGVTLSVPILASQLKGVDEGRISGVLGENISLV